jgi:hypothetical protein
MKNALILCPAIMCLFLLSQCKNTPTAAVTANEGSPSVKVALGTAAADINRFSDVCQNKLQVVPIRAFTIRAKDLLEVLGLPESDTSVCQYKHARAYLGIDANNNFKLYFNPVVGANLANNIGGDDLSLTNANGQLPAEYVLDLNTPCPKVCAGNNIFTLTGSETHQ